MSSKRNNEPKGLFGTYHDQHGHQFYIETDLEADAAKEAAENEARVIREQQQAKDNFLKAFDDLDQALKDLVPNENLSKLTSQHPDYDKIDQEINEGVGGVDGVIENLNPKRETAKRRFSEMCGKCALTATECAIWSLGAETEEHKDMAFRIFKDRHPKAFGRTKLRKQKVDDPKSPC